MNTKEYLGMYCLCFFQLLPLFVFVLYISVLCYSNVGDKQKYICTQGLENEDIAYFGVIVFVSSVVYIYYTVVVYRIYRLLNFPSQYYESDGESVQSNNSEFHEFRI